MPDQGVGDRQGVDEHQNPSEAQRVSTAIHDGGEQPDGKLVNRLFHELHLTTMKIFKIVVGDELYLWYGGKLVYKRWLGLGYGRVFNDW
jgi:hypothetical protein